MSILNLSIAALVVRKYNLSKDSKDKGTDVGYCLVKNLMPCQYCSCLLFNPLNSRVFHFGFLFRQFFRYVLVFYLYPLFCYFIRYSLRNMRERVICRLRQGDKEGKMKGKRQLERKRERGGFR